jgi:hypothetical protein
MQDRYDQTSGTAVQFTTVMTNEGDGYNPAVGQFIVPVNCTYFFMASSVDYIHWEITMALMVDDNIELNRVHTDPSNPNIPASVHGLASLHQGQRVWVRAGSNTCFCVSGVAKQPSVAFSSTHKPALS